MSHTILIVDDRKMNINMLVSILGEGYTIMAALGGRNAISILERKKPDLVLLDVYMPEVDGFDVLRYIKGKKEMANIPVIFVTGEHDASVEEKGLELGAVDYVKKPYNAGVINAKVKNHLEFKDYRDNLESMVQDRTKELLASREAIIMGMSLMSESHDKVTGEHIERIKFYTKILVGKLHELHKHVIPSRDAMSQIVLFSPLHDIGKVGISDVILHKEGLLTREEYELMKSHTWVGADLLRKTESFLTSKEGDGGLDVAIEIAEYHHERYDGTGYPHGLKGEDIPISARIVALSDVYDALRSPRPYKKGIAHEAALEVIFNGDDKTSPDHFDPLLLEVFRMVHGEFDEVFRWKTNQSGTDLSSR